MAVNIRFGEKFKKNWKKIVIYGLFCCAAILGVMIGYFLSSMAELPEVSQLQYYKPNIITSIFSEGGTTIQEYAIEKRMVVRYQEIPKHFIDAIIAIEDERFFEHSGIDVKGIMRAMWRNLWSGKIVQGASTLTMQLSRNIFLSTEQTWTRKIKEALYAIKIEKYYTKEQILELFANQVYFGHNRYGLASASDFFFSKKPQDINLEESALLAGILNGPNYYTPKRHPIRALKRRNLVLDRMVETGAITREEAVIAKEKPIIMKEPKSRESLAPYFTEEIRKFLSSKYGSQKVYRDGLKVYSTLNLKMQQAADIAMKDGLHALDKRQGWRGPIKNIFNPPKPEEGEEPVSEPTEPVTLENYKDPMWEEVDIKEGARLNGIVLSSAIKEAKVRIKDKVLTLDFNEARWTLGKSLDRILKKGDVALFHIDSIDNKGKIKISLDQEPIVEGALVAIEARTGRILAMVGGYDFARSPFNRVTQSKLQAGSAFKPIVYVTALETNMALTDRVVDEPSIFMEAGMEEPYQPENEKKNYSGIVTLRTALEKSINIPAVKLIDKISPQKVVEMADRMGLKEGIQPVLSLALGACAINPLDLTSVYSIFANGGLYVEPYSIEEITDRDGNTIYQHTPKTREVISQEDAFLITYALEGVIQNGGTGWKAKALGVPLAGKTGTTDDYTDAWFVGYSPSIICGVWVGFSEGKKSLGKGEVGARAALPIWIDFMKVAIYEKPGGEFKPPVGIVFKLIEKRTGLLATPDTPAEFVFQEAFKPGTEPTRYVTPEDLVNIEQPYHMQERDLSIF
ncbi:MAG: PBP1A family penicillin-binding protein [Acidobacteria bacterium]|nr:PBP1A family penicillin-binding protein [Acidobacteriota bacterium]